MSEASSTSTGLPRWPVGTIVTINGEPWKTITPVERHEASPEWHKMTEVQRYEAAIRGGAKLLEQQGFSLPEGIVDRMLETESHG